MTGNNIITTGKNIVIRDKKLSDVRNDYNWSRDAELSRLDAAYPIEMSYDRYVDEYTAEMRFPSLSRKRFAIDTLDGKHIGNCSYYNIDHKRNEAEVGIMIGDPDYRDKGYGSDVIQTLLKYIFENTKFNRLYLKTLDWNKRAHKCFIKSGFKPYNHILRDGYNFLMMEITRKQWEKLRKQQEQDEPNTPVPR